jgi:hypothetical protein
MTRLQRFRRACAMLVWRVLNPATARPEVRIRIRGRWRVVRATVRPWDEAMARGFNRYARLGPATLGIDPALVRVDLR